MFVGPLKASCAMSLRSFICKDLHNNILLFSATSWHANPQCACPQLNNVQKEDTIRLIPVPSSTKITKGRCMYPQGHLRGYLHVTHVWSNSLESARGQWSESIVIEVTVQQPKRWVIILGIEWLNSWGFTTEALTSERYTYFIILVCHLRWLSIIRCCAAHALLNSHTLQLGQSSHCLWFNCWDAIVW